MPFRARGKVVQVKRGGRWVKLSAEGDASTARRKARALNAKLSRGEIK